MRQVTSKLTHHDALHWHTLSALERLAQLPERIVVLFMASNAPFSAYKTIAQRMHVSAKSARRWAASLEQKGYLKREMRVESANRFHLKGLMDALVKLKKGQKAC